MISSLMNTNIFLVSRTCLISRELFINHLDSSYKLVFLSNNLL